jgi:hypothetical protein
MTDTRTTQTSDPAADAADRSANVQPDERLSTADIAGGRTDEPTARPAGSTARPEGAASPRTDSDTADTRTHKSDMPDASVAPLFSDDAANDLRGRWDDIQAGFVDEPRSSVENADTLVAEVMKRLADSFATERQALEQQWSGGGDPSTEDLRVALRRYRSFFDRLLSI